LKGNAMIEPSVKPSNHSKACWRLFLTFCTLAATVPPASAQNVYTSTWVQTAAGTYDWDNNSNWLPSTGFPNNTLAAVYTAVLGNAPYAPSGNQIINLNQPTSLAALQFGNTGVASYYTIAPGTAGLLNYHLFSTSNGILQQTAFSAANAISADIVLYDTSLDVTNDSTEPLTISGNIIEQSDFLEETNLGKYGIGKLILSGSNTYTGFTSIHDGALALTGHDNVLSSKTAVLLGDNAAGTSGKLVLGSGATPVDQAVAYVTCLGGADNRIAGGSTAISTLTMNIGAVTKTYTGSLGGAGVNENNLALAKIGAGQLILDGTGSNTFVGGTRIQRGSIAVTNANDRLPIDSLVVLGSSSFSGKLILGNGTTAVNQTLAGLETSGAGLDNRVVGGGTGIALLTLDIDGSVVTTDTFSGALGGTGLRENNLALTKTGAGQLTLAGINTYTGTTIVSRGRLDVDGSLQSSEISVRRNAKLGGTGTVGNVTVEFGGHISPGDSIGVLNMTGKLWLQTGALMDFDLGLPSGSDRISMPSATLKLEDQIFEDFLFYPQSGFGPGVYTLIHAGGIDGFLGDDSSGEINGMGASLGVSGNDIVLTVVPEPSSFMLCGLCALVLMINRRTRRSCGF
jgi:autotransporter-associated beta strand protein